MIFKKKQFLIFFKRTVLKKGSNRSLISLKRKVYGFSSGCLTQKASQSSLFSQGHLLSSLPSDTLLHQVPLWSCTTLVASSLQVHDGFMTMLQGRMLFSLLFRMLPQQLTIPASSFCGQYPFWHLHFESSSSPMTAQVVKRRTRIFMLE